MFQFVKKSKVFQNQIYDVNEKQPTIYQTAHKAGEKEEYDIVQCEIAPAKIICPDCGGITLEGLDYCSKCGGELNPLDAL